MRWPCIRTALPTWDWSSQQPLRRGELQQGSSHAGSRMLLLLLMAPLTISRTLSLLVSDNGAGQVAVMISTVRGGKKSLPSRKPNSFQSHWVRYPGSEDLGGLWPPFSPQLRAWPLNSAAVLEQSSGFSSPCFQDALKAWWGVGVWGPGAQYTRNDSKGSQSWTLSQYIIHYGHFIFIFPLLFFFYFVRLYVVNVHKCRSRDAINQLQFYIPFCLFNQKKENCRFPCRIR